MSAFLFLGMILSLYIIVNGYLFARLFSALAGTGVLRALASLSLLFLAASFPAGQILSRHAPGKLSELLLVAGSLYIAPMIYGFIFTVIADILRLLNGIVALTPVPPPFGVRGRLATVMAILALTLLVTFAGAWNAKNPVVRRFNVDRNAGGITGAAAAPSADGNIRIAAVSDIHLGRMIGNAHLKKIVDLIVEEKPDIVLFMGDVIDDAGWFASGARENHARELFSSLSPRLGVWAVPGNHEYYAGLASCKEFLASAGIRVLQDEWEKPGREILLVGRDDRSAERFGKGRRPLADILADARSQEAPGSRDLPLIVMDHQPIGLQEAEDSDATLQLSGHTHKGQLMPVNLIVARLYERYYGPYRKGKTSYYISSGAGTWGPPVRTSGRPEVVIIDLKPVAD